MKDLLELMLATQKGMQEKTYGYDFSSMTEEEAIEFIRWNILALTDELHEALAEVGWKPWATSRHINREAFVGELIDAWHFLMNLLLVVGVDADELGEKYLLKQKRNVERQLREYDGISGKCQSCKRALDDVVAKGGQPYSAWFCSLECAQVFAGSHA